MKLGDAISKYRDYRQQLCERQKLLTKKLKDAQTNAEMTGDCMWNEQAATLELSLSENKKLFEENQKVLDGLIEQRQQNRHRQPWEIYRRFLPGRAWKCRRKAIPEKHSKGTASCIHRDSVLNVSFSRYNSHNLQEL